MKICEGLVDIDMRDFVKDDAYIVTIH